MLFGVVGRDTTIRMLLRYRDTRGDLWKRFGAVSPLWSC